MVHMATGAQAQKAKEGPSLAQLDVRPEGSLLLEDIQQGRAGEQTEVEDTDAHQDCSQQLAQGGQFNQGNSPRHPGSPHREGPRAEASATGTDQRLKSPGSLRQDNQPEEADQGHPLEGGQEQGNPLKGAERGGKPDKLEGEVEESGLHLMI